MIEQECLSVKGQPPLVLTLTLVLKLDLDMVLIYHCAKKKSLYSICFKSYSPNGHTDRQTHTQTQQKHYLSAYAGSNNSHSFKPNGKLYGYVTHVSH